MKRVLALVAAACVTAACVFAQSDLQALAVVKLGRSETITVKQLKTRVNFVQKSYDSYGVTLTPEQRAEILEAMIDEKLIVQAAAREGLSVSDDKVNQAFLNTFAQQIGRLVTEAELETIIQQSANMSLNEYLIANTGMGIADYKAYLKNQLIVQQYVYMKKQAEIASIAATDEEIRAAYEMNQTAFVRSDMVRLFLVVVPKGNDAAKARDTAAQLRNAYLAGTTQPNAILADARNGTEYNAVSLFVAKTTQQATQLGWTYDKILELFGKPVNYTSDVNETSTDYQFYVVMNKYDRKLLELSDLVQPETTITVYDYIKSNISNQKQSQYFSQCVTMVADELDTPEYVDRKKTGDELKALLNW